MSRFHIFFTVVLLSELSSQWLAMALPVNKIEDDTTEREGLGFVLNEKTISEPDLGFLVRRNTGLGSHIRRDKGTPQINMFSDMHMKGQDSTGPSFPRGIALLTDWNSSQFPESTIKIDRRDTDLDMLRCMIGRVYRPCWEI